MILRSTVEREAIQESMDDKKTSGWVHKKQLNSLGENAGVVWCGFDQHCEENIHLLTDSKRRKIHIANVALQLPKSATLFTR